MNWTGDDPTRYPHGGAAGRPPAEGGPGDGRAGGGHRSPAGPSRRGLLIGGAALVAGAGAAYAGRDELARLWWLYSGATEPRVEGEVDHPGAEWIPAASGNYRRANRPRDYPIDRVVIHMPEATYPITLRVFQDSSHRAATHYVLRSEDGHVAQMARELDVAFHAGDRPFNERSIGIEHEGWADQPEYLTEEMYASSARLVAGICDRYEIPRDREHIVGHNEIPGIARICPGPHWDWDRYIAMVREV
ncbi:N-acetylmuramoyl-L-alanine amidase [Streptomyces alkaliphilus]|uniref:N-acetylmuramoyl-L-alanine amidase n=1 Tax=Streptomyces alkaliphilus TaxID=1472722 RepID=UPI001181588F|nr:N-acetylmuramoyl-L-alanine amidase [Streptomyces alkaliphilus]MQS05844.1 N-acetylmuramoyl-L-alanine amidase [Streptomyces alkaliphilus]